MIFTKKTLQLHVLCWIIYITYEVSMVELVSGKIPIIHYITFYILNIAFFYGYSLFLLKYVSNSIITNLWRIPTFLILELAVYILISICISSYLNTYIYHKTGSFNFWTFKYLISTFYRGIIFCLYGTGYYFLMNYIRKKEKELTQVIENDKLKIALLRAEQDFLRAQINPHLLFNTLSFIKYATKTNLEEANDAIMRLSDIMGFALESNSQVILVTKELEQVENIIELNQLRFNHKLKINYTTALYSEDIVIIPILILTLVENIFKHGNLLDENYPAEILVGSTAEHLFLKTSNLPNFNKSLRSKKTGLINTKIRLEQFYKNCHEFNYGLNNEGLFTVDMKIKLKTIN